MIRPTAICVALLLLASCQEAPSGSKSVAIVGSAERIISLAPHLTELIYAAGAGDRLVGTVEYSDYPAAALEVPRIGDAFRVDYERVAVLQPDLVLAWGSGNPQEIVGKLQSLGYRVIALEPQSIDSIAAELREIGRLAGTQSVAEQSALELLARRDSLRQAHQNVKTLKVFFQIAAEPLMSVNGQHAISDIINLCGGENVMADAPTLAPVISREAAIAASPDVILAAVSPAEGDWRDAWSSWQHVPAVTAGRLYGIDRDLITRSGPRIIEGAQQVCAALAAARGSSG